MNFNKFIEDNVWETAKSNDKEYHFLIDWKSTDLNVFKSFVKLIEDNEDNASYIHDGMVYCVLHSPGRFKHTVIIRHKI